MGRTNKLIPDGNEIDWLRNEKGVSVTAFHEVRFSHIGKIK